jgi:hypothetical protein
MTKPVYQLLIFPFFDPSAHTVSSKLQAYNPNKNKNKNKVMPTAICNVESTRSLDHGS